MQSKKLKKATDIAVKKSLGVKVGERFLIVTNPAEGIDSIARSMYDSAREVGAIPVLFYQDDRPSHFPMDHSVYAALRTEPDVYFHACKNTLGRDPYAEKNPYKFRGKTYDHILFYLFSAKKTRGAWCGGIKKNDFARLVDVDYERIQLLSKKLEKRITKAETIEIGSNGFKLCVSIKKRKSHTDKGNFNKPGNYGNLPCGEVFVSPKLGSVEGRVMLDTCISTPTGDIKFKEPAILEINGNSIISISGGKDARKLKKVLYDVKKRTEKLARSGKIKKSEAGSYIKNTKALGEIGLGINPMANKVGRTLMEDEKVFGTAHIAIGSNYDGDQKSLIHMDGVISRPEITLVYPNGRRETIVRNREYLV